STNSRESADQQYVIDVLTGHRSAGLVCAFNNSIVFDVRHSRILRQQQRAAFNENQREAPQGGSSVLAVRRPISADPERLKIGCRKVRYRTDRIASEERYSIRDSP